MIPTKAKWLLHSLYTHPPPFAEFLELNSGMQFLALPVILSHTTEPCSKFY